MAGDGRSASLFNKITVRWMMPLKDHFQKPFSKMLPWDAFHAAWSTKIVESLMRLLPKGYVAFPNNHLGYGYEIDVGSWERSDAGPEIGSGVAAGSGLARIFHRPAPRPRRGRRWRPRLIRTPEGQWTGDRGDKPPYPRGRARGGAPAGVCWVYGTAAAKRGAVRRRTMRPNNSCQG